MPIISKYVFSEEERAVVTLVFGNLKNYSILNTLSEYRHTVPLKVIYWWLMSPSLPDQHLGILIKL